MRGLKTKDIKPALKLVRKMNVGEKIKDIVKTTNDLDSAGVEIVGLILATYTDTEGAEEALMEFLSGPFEMSSNDVLELNLEELLAGIKDIGIEKIISFFKTLRA